MVRPAVFLSALGLFCGLCLLVSPPLQRTDAFDPSHGNALLWLDNLAVEDVAALKIFHLERSAPAEAILFGNSRSLPLQASDLGLPEDGFFNLSLSGASLRSSILLLEELKRIDRLPKLALISFDHAEINYYANPEWATARARWRQLVLDLWTGLVHPTFSWSDLARMAARHARTEGMLFARKFNATRVLHNLKSAAGWTTRRDEAWSTLFVDERGYRVDGSRPVDPHLAPIAIPNIVPSTWNVLPSYRSYDFDRLADIRRTGTRIIVYETVLHPQIHRRVMKAPSPEAVETRRNLLESCARTGIECIVAPADYDGTTEGWSDIAHPPAAVMGDLLRPVLEAGKARP